MTQPNHIEQTTAYLKSLDPELNVETINFDQLSDSTQVKQTLGIKIMSIFGGLLSSIAFFGFLIVVGLYKSNIALTILGILAIAIGVFIGKKFKQILWDTISVSTFSIGFMALGMALAEFHLNEQHIALFFGAIALLCLCLRPNYIISFVSTLILNGCILTFILLNNVEELIHLQVSLLAIVLSFSFIMEAKLLHKSFKIGISYHAIRTAVLVCFLIGLGLLHQDIVFSSAEYWNLVTAGVCTLILLYLTSKLMANLAVSDKIIRLGIYALTLLVVLPTALFPGIAGSILVILLCFGVNYKTGFVLGIIALLWFIGEFYYDLNYTLLTKSIMLLVSGIVLLLLYFFISKRTES